MSDSSSRDETQVHDAATAAALPADAAVAAGGSGHVSDPATAADPPAPHQPASIGASVPPAGGKASPLPGPLAALPIDPELLEAKPEILVGAAFVGGFLFAKVLRRIGGG